MESGMIEIGPGKLPAYFVRPEGKKVSAVILIEEIWGLNEHIKEVANRIAEKGFAVIAPELLAGMNLQEKLDPNLFKQMSDHKTKDEAQKKLREIFAPVNSPAFALSALAKIRECFDYLEKRNDLIHNVGVVGFCFGGTYSFATACEMPVNAAIAFYGKPPEPASKLSKITCPVMAFYGEEDKNLTDDLPKLEKEMADYGKDFRYFIYPKTGHAFFNDTNPARYNEAAAKDSWKKAITFLSERLGKK